MPNDAFDWFVYIFTGLLLVLLVVVLVIAFNSDAPVCPPGQDYVFSHYINAGRVLVPQYVCR